jgi:DnaK suppressor protein
MAGVTVMTEFSAEALQHFHDLLIQRRDGLLAVQESANEAAETVELDQSRMGRLSRMDAMQGQAMSVETRRRREEELRNIVTALARIESGDYGYCIACDEPIASARLEVDPAAKHCIKCAV